MGIPQSNRRPSSRSTREPNALVGAVDPFDPSDHKVDDVLAYAAENPDDRARLLQLELAGKNRVTLIDALDG